MFTIIIMCGDHIIDVDIVMKDGQTMLEVEAAFKAARAVAAEFAKDEKVADTTVCS
jgi:hypothetical protein